VVSDSFEVEGSIALVDLQDDADATRSHGGDPSAHEHRRQGRLNDVLIVLERNAPSIEQAILARLRGLDIAGPNTTVHLRFDEHAPRFSVAIRPGKGDPAADVLARQGGAIADEVEQEILGSIARRTTAARHFSPEVEIQPTGAGAAPANVARNRPTAGSPPLSTASGAARRRPVKATIWLQTLFFLIAAVLLGAAYLYLTQPA